MPESLFQEAPILGVSTGTSTFDQATLIREVSLRMAEQARRELLLFARSLDPRIYDQGPFLNAVQRLALSRPNLPVRILVFEARATRQRGHRLIELARRLTSRIAIRRVGEDDQDRLDAFLIADERGYVRRQAADTMEATADFNNPYEARRLRGIFEQLWERSDAETELRRLHL